MQIQIQPTFGRERQQPLDPSIETGMHGEEGAEHAAMLGDMIGDRLAARLQKILDRRQGHALQVNATGPFALQLAKHRPADLMVRRLALEVGADRDRAVGVGAA